MLLVLFAMAAIELLKDIAWCASEDAYIAELYAGLDTEGGDEPLSWRARGCSCFGSRHVRAADERCEGSWLVSAALAAIPDWTPGAIRAAEQREAEAERKAKRSPGFVVRKPRFVFEPRAELDVPEVETSLLTEDWFVGFISREQLVAEFAEDDSPMVSPEQRSLDAATLAWLSRDVAEVQRESKRRSERGGSVEGDRHAPGLAGEREWLDAQLREIERSFRAGEVQLEAAKRHAKALRARFNTRRYVEALGGDPDSAEFAAWRAKSKLSYRALNGVLTAEITKRFLECELETLAVPGLITEEPRRRAPQFARPKMTSIAVEA